MKLSPAKRYLLTLMEAGAILVNGDENERPWWIDGGQAVNASTAASLAKGMHIHFFRHEGGQPGVDFYRISSIGRAALKDATHAA